MFEVADAGRARQQFDAFGHSFVRFVVLMAVMPGLKTALVRREREQPDFLRAIERTDDLHPTVAQCIVHQMRPSTERGLHFGAHAIRDDKAAEHHKARCRVWRNVRGNGDPHLRFCKGSQVWLLFQT